jgi:hypothetical protein
MWLPALAAASIIKVIMAGQRMRQPARDRNGSYTALLAVGADIHPSMAMCKLRARRGHRSAAVSTGDRRIHRSVPDAAWSPANARHGAAGTREHDPPGTACAGGPGRTQARFTVPSRSLT